MRRLASAFALMAVALLLGSGIALAATITGTSGSDALEGTGGSDRISGRGGADTLSGKGGDDRLFGGAGADAIRGGDGDDRMVGGPVDSVAKDSLLGGRGDDRINVRNVPATEDAVACGPGFDTVTADSEDEVADDCERVNRG